MPRPQTPEVAGGPWDAAPVRIVWTAGAAHTALATLPADAPLDSVLRPEDIDTLERKAAASAHPMFRLAHDVFVELPAPTWRGGDLLVYLPRRGWLVRRRKVEHWYVDIGIFRHVSGALHAWTDLWLDVTAPKDAGRYDLLDADQFAAALRDGRMAAVVAATALEQLDALLRCLREGAFPPPEVRFAEAFASEQRPPPTWRVTIASAGALDNLAPPRAARDAGTATGTSMRLAILSDVHANAVALDAVLADIAARGGADGYWVLGDLVSPGYDPAGVLRRLTALPNVRVARGNTDRYTLGDPYPHLSIAEVQADPSQVPRLVRVSRVGAWAHGFLAATGWLDWLAALPLELRETLPDGTRALGVHAAPGADDGPGIEPDATDEQVSGLVAGCDADLVLVGHVHKPSERRVSVDARQVHVVNVGAVTGEHPTYALLNAAADGYTITMHRTECDMEAVARARRAASYDEAMRGTVF